MFRKNAYQMRDPILQRRIVIWARTPNDVRLRKNPTFFTSHCMWAYPDSSIFNSETSCILKWHFEGSCSLEIGRWRNNLNRWIQSEKWFQGYFSKCSWKKKNYLKGFKLRHGRDKNLIRIPIERLKLRTREFFVLFLAIISGSLSSLVSSSPVSDFSTIIL